MTLQSSAPITLAQIATEFGASLPANLGSFLRGGSYVPNTGTNAAVPDKPILQNKQDYQDLADYKQDKYRPKMKKIFSQFSFNFKINNIHLQYKTLLIAKL